MYGIEIQYYKVIIRKNVDNLKDKQSQNNLKDKDRTTKVIELQTIKNSTEKNK